MPDKKPFVAFRRRKADQVVLLQTDSEPGEMPVQREATVQDANVYPDEFRAFSNWHAQRGWTIERKGDGYVVNGVPA